VKPGWLVVEADGKPVAESIARVREAFADSTLLDLMLARAIEGRLSADRGKSVKILFEDGEGKEQSLALESAEPSGKPVVFGNMPAMYVTYESRTVTPEVGYITFNAFMDPATTMQAFARDMASFADTRGLIIDLRGNPGGIGGMAMGMGGWFVSDSKKSLGTMSTRDSELNFVLNPRLSPYRGKVAVLIDGLSGSTSEILAAGLRDLGLARLFGTRTAGAALPSLFERLPNGDGFQYAFGNYVSASGDVLEGKGVAPDQEVVPTREALLEGRDPVIDAAVAWIDAETKK
jgi:carboxyl-terminal processing protease